MTDAAKIECRMIFVVAHNGYTEGHGLPYLAFEHRQDAVMWVQSQTEAWSVAEIPVYPDIPGVSWLNQEKTYP